MEFQILPAFLNIKRFGMEEMMRGLWYKNPAKYWEEALPVGNGRLGAMIYGRFDQEIIQLNEERVNSKGKNCRGRTDDSLGNVGTAPISTMLPDYGESLS